MIAPFSEAITSVEMSLLSFLFATMGMGYVCELIYLALIEEFAYLVYSRLVVIWYIMFIFVMLFTAFIKYIQYVIRSTVFLMTPLLLSSALEGFSH